MPVLSMLPPRRPSVPKPRKSEIEFLLRRALQRLGLDVRRYRPEATPEGRLASMLRAHGVGVVLDVGANTGQFAASLRAAGYSGRLVSFEPLAAAHAELSRHAATDPGWIVATRGALGDAPGEVEIHVAANSVSSSVLPMLDRHRIAAPDSVDIGVEHVPVTTLDLVAPAYLAAGESAFLKIDTQGYEDRVLSGATATLPQVIGVQVELSLVPLYEGQSGHEAMADRLSALGYVPWAIWPGFCDARDGRMLQVDAVYFRP